MSFPLSNERKSGFLAPSYGTTNRNGFDLRTPYYWNIKPNMDATITPRLLTDSGVMAMGEYRYLYSRGSGEINVEYLPSDNAREDDHRNFIDLELNQRFASTGNLFATYSRVSDKFYFEDFGSQLSVTSTSFLEQRADMTYSGNNWNILTRVQNFQTVNRSIQRHLDLINACPKYYLIIISRKKTMNLTMDSKVKLFTSIKVKTLLSPMVSNLIRM